MEQTFSIFLMGMYVNWLTNGLLIRKELFLNVGSNPIMLTSQGLRVARSIQSTFNAPAVMPTGFDSQVAHLNLQLFISYLLYVSTNYYMEKSDKWKQAMLERRGKEQNKPKEYFVCEFCKKEFYVKKETFTKHIKYYCKENPNRINEGRYGRHLTDEQKQKISESRKKYLDEHPDKVPFKLNHSSKESYPEKYFREWLQKENIFSEKEYPVERYSLDFAWPEKGIYLEVDGGQHTLNWMKDHDTERTDFLTEKGWVCIARVFWPHFCSFNDDEKIRFLKNLKNTILTSEVFHDFRSEKELLQKEQSEHREKLIKQGKVNSLGRPCDYMNSTEDWEIRKDKILSCGVDLSKIGWKVKVQKATGLTRKQVDLTIDKFYEDFKSLIFIRKKA